MTLEMAKAILKPLLLKKSGPIDITFMGGETLLAMDVIRPLIEWTEKETWNRDFKFFGSTNGTLLNDELKDWLKKHKHIITRYVKKEKMCMSIQILSIISKIKNNISVPPEKNSLKLSSK